MPHPPANPLQPPGAARAMSRDALLALPDEKLLELCRVDRMRGSGRGGQKRNVTESAVRITYPPRGVQAGSDATRSQAQNRKLALRSLRRRLALEWREPPPDPWPHPQIPGNRDRTRPLWTAHVLDLLAAHSWKLAESARAMGLSTARLARELARDPELWQRVNRERAAAGLPPLRTPH